MILEILVCSISFKLKDDFYSGVFRGEITGVTIPFRVKKIENACILFIGIWVGFCLNTGKRFFLEVSF